MNWNQKLWVNWRWSSRTQPANRLIIHGVASRRASWPTAIQQLFELKVPHLTGFWFQNGFGKSYANRSGHQPFFVEKIAFGHCWRGRFFWHQWWINLKEMGLVQNFCLVRRKQHGAAIAIANVAMEIGSWSWWSSKIPVYQSGVQPMRLFIVPTSSDLNWMDALPSKTQSKSWEWNSHLVYRKVINYKRKWRAML